jgi:DNA-binding CsgD family transcriptional regulator
MRLALAFADDLVWLIARRCDVIARLFARRLNLAARGPSAGHNENIPKVWGKGGRLGMSKATPKNGKKMSSARIEDNAGLPDLMRALVAVSRSAVAETFAHGLGAGEQIVIDTDVDGDRYVLIRMPQVERKSLPLSPRELEIVRMVAQGHPNKIIAVVLNISAWTVCTHLRRIFAKLGVSSRAAMVARLVEFGAPETAAGSERSVLRSTAGAPPLRPPGPTAPQPYRGSCAAESGLPAQRRIAVGRGHAPLSRVRAKLRLPAEAG